MLNWHITRGGAEGTHSEIGWKDLLLLWSSMDRDTAEQAAYLAHGDWLEADGKWFAFHRQRLTNPAERCRAQFGIAFGTRFWLWSVEWNKPLPDAPKQRRNIALAADTDAP